MIIDNMVLEKWAEPQHLKDGDLHLEPTSLREAEDYILKLACKDRYNITPREQLARGLQFVRYAWVAKNCDGVGGVVFMCYLEHKNWWTLDAYKQDEVNNKEGDWSYRAGRLAVEWFFKNHDAKELFTIHRTDNRAATTMCERLGFEARFKNPEFIILSIRRSKWVLAHL